MTTLPANAFPPGATSWSHWHKTCPRVAGVRRLESPPADVEVAIVGLGICGAALAHDCVRLGVDPSRVVVLEARAAAFGASGRNGGFVLTCPGPELLDWKKHFGHERVIELVR